MYIDNGFPLTKGQRDTQVVWTDIFKTNHHFLILVLVDICFDISNSMKENVHVYQKYLGLKWLRAAATNEGNHQFPLPLPITKRPVKHFFLQRMDFIPLIYSKWNHLRLSISKLIFKILAWSIVILTLELTFSWESLYLIYERVWRKKDVKNGQ